MEKRHQQRLGAKFADALVGKRVVCLHLPDEFALMDPHLMQRLSAIVPPYLSVP